VTTIAKEKRLYAKISRTDYKKVQRSIKLKCFCCFSIDQPLQTYYFGCISPLLGQAIIGATICQFNGDGIFLFSDHIY